MMEMLKGFRQFLLRGNVVDLAVAVVIGTAFTGVVTALVKDLITPLIASIGGNPDFSALAFTINGSRFAYGEFINAVIAFVIMAAVVFFFVVTPINKLIGLANRNKESVEPGTRKCPECLGEVPVKARRCMFCASVIGGK
jgi:large conductance mechanosensitive channel